MNSQARQYGSKISSEDLKLLGDGKLPPKWSWVNSSINARVAYNANASVYYKEFLPRNRLENFKSLFRGSRCDRAIKMSLVLTKLGFHTPKLICSGKINRQRDYMVTEAANAAGVASYLASYLRRSQSNKTIAWKRKVITALGHEIGRLHQHGIIHGDLRPNNVLVEIGASHPRFYFIDNERSRLWRNSPREKLIRKNLIQIGMLFPIDISRTDRLRFYKAYQSNYRRFGSPNKAWEFLCSVYSATINRLTTTAHYKPEVGILPQSAMEKGLIVPKED